MYGNGGATQGIQGSPGNIAKVEPPIEQLSSINESALKQLYEARGGIQHLLAKVRGAEPETVEKGATPGGYMMATAYEIRSLANDIARQVGELHRVIGQDK